jgi:hypothetical protein
MGDRKLSKILKAQQRFVGRLADLANRLEPAATLAARFAGFSV